MLLLGALTAILPPRSTSASPMAPEIPAIEPKAAVRAWKSIVLHHSATPGGNVESIDSVHRNNRDRAGNRWLGIGYHFVVGNGRQMGDGEIQATFRWLEQLPGAHAGSMEHNQDGIGICLIGNFDESAPTARQLAAVRGLVKSLTQRYSIPRERLLRHLDLQATLCPGRLFPWDLVRLDVPPAKTP